MKKIVLASASPRRRTLLLQLGLRFEVDPGDHEEDLSAPLGPRDLARTLSSEKAGAVAKRHSDAIVIAADTLVVLDGKVIGKPGTEADARRILHALSGKEHSVITAFTILDTGTGKAVTRVVETAVRFTKMSDDEIEAYVRTGEPLDKAGAYAIQGLGAILVEKIEGDYFNVVGLPLNALAGALKEFGFNVL